MGPQSIRRGSALSPQEQIARETHWLVAYNLMMRNLEIQLAQRPALSADWRVVGQPVNDELHHLINLMVLAREPAAWQEPALIQGYAIKKDEFELSIDSSRILELLTVKAHLALRGLLDAMAQHNPDRARDIALYLGEGNNHA